METITLKKEQVAFYFAQAELNLEHIDSGLAYKHNKCYLEYLQDNPEIFKKLHKFVFNGKDISTSAQNEVNVSIMKLYKLRNFYSHYVHKDDCKNLDKYKKILIQRYYNTAIKETNSEDVKLEIFESDKNNGTKLTEAGVLFWLCMFLKKSQANELISSVKGFKDSRTEKQPRRNLFTYYSIREGYKILPESRKHFLLFQMANHLVKQDEGAKQISEKHIPKGRWFHKIATTFLTESKIVDGLKFYDYQTRLQKEKYGKEETDKNIFKWIEPYKGNSYFEIAGYKGVICEDELKELCYALFCKGKRRESASITVKFLEDFVNAKTLQDVENSDVLEKKYFPANYFSTPNQLNAKQEIIARIENKITQYQKMNTNEKAYDKMRVVMDFVNFSIPAGQKPKGKKYKHYLNMVRFWSSEKDNIKSEFLAKEIADKFEDDFWRCQDLEAGYIYSKGKIVKLLKKLKNKIEQIDEREFDKYRQINDAKDLSELEKLARRFGAEWKEKEDWEEYFRQRMEYLQKKESDMIRWKLTIMKQRVTAGLKVKHGISNLKLRIRTDSAKSKDALVKSNRVAIPRGFVKRYILNSEEKPMQKLRDVKHCKILQPKEYRQLSAEFYKEKEMDKMTAVNGLWEKNKLIALAVEYLSKDLKVKLPTGIKADGFTKQKVRMKFSKQIIEEIPMKQYPSLANILNKDYLNKINNYNFSEDAHKSIFDKIKFIEKERMEFIESTLDFEKWLYNDNVIDKKWFNDAKFRHFSEICDKLKKKGWNEKRLIEISGIRNAALHSDLPIGKTFADGISIIKALKNESKQPKPSIKSVDFLDKKCDNRLRNKNLEKARCDKPAFGR